MSEESLLDTATPETDTQPPVETTDVEWRWQEGVAGEGEKPEWFMDKYKSVADQAAAYPELAKKFGDFTGAPDEYEVSPPVGEDGEPIGEYAEGDPLIESFKELAKESNMSQEGFTKILHWYSKTQTDTVEATRAAEIDKLGDNRESRIKDIADWGRANMSDEEYGMLESTLTTADAVRVAEVLISKSREQSIPANVNTSPGVTQADLDARIADPRYQTDPAFRAETAALFSKLYGQGEHREVRQQIPRKSLHSTRIPASAAQKIPSARFTDT